MCIRDSVEIPFKTEFLINSDLFNNVQELQGISIGGAIDCINGSNIIEFKHVNKIDKSHKIQTAIYMYLYEMYKNYHPQFNSENEETNNYYLLNVYDNTKFKFKASLLNLKKMMEYIIYNKYFTNNDITDDEFYEKCNNIRNKYEM